MTDLNQIDHLEQLGIAFAGLIFYAKSPRYCLRHLTTSQIKSIKNINKVGVFVNASEDEIRTMVDECRLHMVQLHGDETPRFCEKIADYISVIKAFRIGADENISYKVREYMDVCDMFLFDTAPGKGDSNSYGGTGKKFDWNMLKDQEVGKPYFLGGGIGPDDAGLINDFTKSKAAKALFAVDVNSRFEKSPGVKDMLLVENFQRAIQNL